jgi:sugar phosphate isomerase/epimerase
MAFELGIITDEVDDDLTVALDHIRRWELPWIELRLVNGRNLVTLDDAEAADVAAAVKTAGRRVICLASPFLKCSLHVGQAPPDDPFVVPGGYVEHLAVLDRALELAQCFEAPYIRIFAFWREPDPVAVHDEIVRRLEAPVRRAERAGVTLVLENEATTCCATGAETAAVVRQVGSPALRVLWDPGNAANADEQPYPAGYAAVRDLVAHVQVKDVARPNAGVSGHVPVGQGTIDYVGQFRALAADGYGGVISLEPHYRPPNRPRADAARECLDALHAALDRAAL